MWSRHRSKMPALRWAHWMGGGGGPPGPSEQELRLQGEEANLIKLQADILRENRKAGQGLEKILLRRAGLDRKFKPKSADQARFDRLKAELKTASPKRQKTIKSKLAEIRKRGKFILEETPEFLAQEEAKRGIEEERTETERLALDREQRALRGELPVDKGLMQDLADREKQVRERLFAQLGEGYETSTPGIEALKQFEGFRERTLDAARRGDIAQFSPLVSGDRFQYISPDAFIDPGSRVFSGSGELAQNTRAFRGSLANERFNSFQPGSSTSSALGGAAGGALSGALIGASAGGVGAPFGAVAGGLAGLFSSL